MNLFLFSFSLAMTFLPHVHGAEYIGEVALQASNGRYLSRNGGQDIQTYHGHIYSESTLKLYSVSGSLSQIPVANLNRIEALEEQLKSFSSVNRVEALEEQVESFSSKSRVEGLEKQVQFLQKELKELQRHLFLIEPDE